MIFKNICFIKRLITKVVCLTEKKTLSFLGTYYRNDQNYQNGYQQRSWGNDGNSGFNAGFKRGGGGGPRGARTERGGRGQFRGQRGGTRGGYVSRGKPHTQQ